jgi:uncharacterized phage protein (TIGR01671 family)
MEYKFRGKRIDNGKWEIGFLYKSKNVYRIITAIAIDKDINENMWYCEGAEVIYETIGQFTTKTDVNNKEIYTGDKLSFSIFDYNGADTQYTGYVVWNDTRFEIWNSPDSEYYGSDGGFDLGIVLAQDDEAEVIGNMYEGKGEKA